MKYANEIYKFLLFYHEFCFGTTIGK